MWFCNTEHHPEYDHREDFIVHMLADHNTSFDESRYNSIQDMFRQPSRHVDGTCNLCMRDSKNLKSHISRHLQQIALFALPRVNETSGSGQAEHQTRSSKETAEDVKKNQWASDDSQSSKISFVEPLDPAPTPFVKLPLERTHHTTSRPEYAEEDQKAITEIPETDYQTWDDITPKFSDARQGKGDEPPLMISSSGMRAVFGDEIIKDWADYYGMRREDIEKVGKKEIERQNILHEIVQKQQNYLHELRIFIELYGDGINRAEPPVVSRTKQVSFSDIFAKLNLIVDMEENGMYPQMLHRMKDQGPWIMGFSDLFREWVRTARTTYLEYCTAYPNAASKFRMELEQNMLFRSFAECFQADKRSKRLPWDHYLKLPVVQSQRHAQLLGALLRTYPDNEEKSSLERAIAEMKAFHRECDERLGIEISKVELLELQMKLKLRPSISTISLNLDHLGRKIILQGDLLRIGGSQYTLIETTAILFDHCLVLAKPIRSKNYSGADVLSYDVSRLVSPRKCCYMIETNKYIAYTNGSFEPRK
jgi:RhoGEF domain